MSAHVENWTAQSNCIKIVKWIATKSAMGASRYVYSDNKWPQGVDKIVVLMYYIDIYIYLYILCLKCNNYQSTCEAVLNSVSQKNFDFLRRII